MINLLVDEAYAFDYLAILKVKNSNVYDKVFHHLSQQIQNINVIIESDEFQQMIKVNRQVFDAVEQVKYGNITAEELNKVNLGRFLAKQQLQKKFFETMLTEFKT